MQQLKKKTTSGLIWSITDLMTNQVLQFVIQIILARLLLPEHFGIVGMILVFIAISNSIIDSGFTQALVRDTNTSNEDYSTVFYFNLSMAIVLYVILYFLANPISVFFEEPQLISILRVLSLGILINSVGIIQRVILIKNVNFKTQTKINIIAGVTSGVVAIICAKMGYGVWSLVIKTLIMQLIQSLLIWFSSKWIPVLVFNFKSFKKFFSFGIKLLLAGIIDIIYNNIFFVIIGKMFSASQLGYYTNSIKLRDVVSMSITAAIQRVTYPVLSSIKLEKERLKYGFRKIIKTSAFIIFPLMIGLAAISDALINLLFGGKWMQSVIYLQLLCFAGMLYPIHAMNLNILQVKGRSDLFLLLEIIKKTLLTVLIALSLWMKLGIIGLICAAVLDSFIAFGINTFFSGREISYSTKEQIKDLTPIFIVSFIMGAFVYYIGQVIPASNFIIIVCQISIGIIIYVLLCKLARIKELNTVYNLLFPLLRMVKLKLY